MAKILKIVGRILGILLELLLICIILFAFFIRTSQFQTYLGKQATRYLSKELDSKMRIGKIDIVFFDRVLLKDIYVEDQLNDTIARLDLIDVKIASFNISKQEVKISSVDLINGNIEIYRDKKTGEYNYGFIQDYFDTGKQKKPRKKKPVFVDIKEVRMNNVYFRYDDYRKEAMDYGMDFNHIKLNKMCLRVNDFKLREDYFSFAVRHLSGKEKSGLDIQFLAVKARIDQNQGLLMKKIVIKTPETRIYSSVFQLRMKSLTGFNHFNSQVRFVSKIDSAWVNFSDVSIFVPQLEGMNQTIALSGNLYDRVPNLLLDNIDLRFGKNTVIQGDFRLPDFANLENSSFKENLRYAYVDLNDIKAIKLPKSSPTQQISLGKELDRLAFFELKRTLIEGDINKFRLDTDRIRTSLGMVSINQPMILSKLPTQGYRFEQSNKTNYDVVISDFQLGKMLNNDQLGVLDGALRVSGKVGHEEVITFDEITGKFNKLGYEGYTYSNVTLENTSFENNIFTSNVKINDPHLTLEFDGSIDLTKKQSLDFDLKIPKADLGKLGFVKDPNATVSADIVSLKMNGTDPNKMEGSVSLDNFHYQENGTTVDLPAMNLLITRGIQDVFAVNSSAADITLKGKFDVNLLPIFLNNIFADRLPTFMTKKELPKNYKGQDYFDIDANLKDVQELLDLYAPQIALSKNSKVNVKYDHRKLFEDIEIRADKFSVRNKNLTTGVWENGIYLNKLSVSQKIENRKLTAFVTGENLHLNDSINVDNVKLNVGNNDEKFQNSLYWDKNGKDSSRLGLELKFLPNLELEGEVRKSHFKIKDSTWNIDQKAKFHYGRDAITVKNFVLENGEQYIGINGKMSDDSKDNLAIRLNELNLKEITRIFGVGADLDGRINAVVNIKKPFTDLFIQGNLNVDELYVEKNEVGNISSELDWNSAKNRLQIYDGALTYGDLKDKTFGFTGNIFPLSDENNLDLDLDFNKTDIGFANALLDSTLINKIKGQLNGKIKVRGKFEDPLINGTLNLANASAKVEMLGINYKMNGPIVFDGTKKAVRSNAIKVIDPDNNNALLDFNVDLSDFSNVKTNIDFFFEKELVGKDFKGQFMVLNTNYKPDEIYYGKVYATGLASIKLAETVDIFVRAKTEKNSKVNIPLSGPAEISETNFIEFDHHQPKALPADITTGINLKMIMQPTKEATIRLIFDEKTDDVITATGEGELTLTMNTLGDVGMTGTYNIDQGNYNFVMSEYAVKEEFKLKKGSSIEWQGTPYDANIKVDAFKEVNANFNAITHIPTSSSGNVKKPVFCTINVGPKLSNIQLRLDLEAQNLNPDEKAALDLIKSNPAELQKQFFYLVVLGDFFGTGSTAGLQNMLFSKVNDAINQFTGKTSVSIGTENSENQSQSSSTYNIGLRRQIGNKWLVTGSFGVMTEGSQSSSTSHMVGDLRLQYMINPDGSFVLTIFNESNNRKVISQSEKGDFTQGVSLNYQESFDKWRNARFVPGRGKWREGKKGKKGKPERIPKEPVAVKPEELKSEIKKGE